MHGGVGTLTNRRHAPRVRAGGVLAALSILMGLTVACSSDSTPRGADSKAPADGQADGSSDVETPSTGDAQAFADPSFGDIAAPCSDGEATIDPNEAGRGTDRLWIGTITDKGSGIQLGLLKEMFDASAAFVDWCNEQGGIAGLEIGLVDLDAEITAVEQAMEVACSDVFAMVGGGDVLDNLQFSGKPESDFHQCGMIDLPAFTVTPEKSNSNGMVAPIPNPVDTRSLTFFRELAKKYPDRLARPLVVYAEIDSTKVVRDQVINILGKIPEFGPVEQIAYSVQGADWKVIADQVKAKNPTAMFFVGDVGGFAPLMTEVKQQGLDPLVVGDSNMYDAVVLGGGDVSEGLVTRVVSGPFEEAARYPAVKKYMDLMEAYRSKVPDAKDAALGVQTMSAWLLLSKGINDCISTGETTITRACVLAALKKVTDWTGGGLHAPTKPGEAKMSECAIGMKIVGGKFVRDFPDADDSAAVDGYACEPGSVVTLSGLSDLYAARAKVDPNRPR